VVDKMKFKISIIVVLILFIFGSFYVINYYRNGGEENVQAYSAESIKPKENLNIKTTEEIVKVIPINPPSSYNIEDVFESPKASAKCGGSVCEFEFNIKNPLTKDIPLDSEKLKLWYIKMADSANVKSFKYFQDVQVNKTRNIITKPSTCNNNVIGQYPNLTDIIEYQCSKAESILES